MNPNTAKMPAAAASTGVCGTQQAGDSPDDTVRSTHPDPNGALKRRNLRSTLVLAAFALAGWAAACGRARR